MDHEQGQLGGEAGADREPLAAAAGADRRRHAGAVRGWRPRSFTRSISITTCSTCRARVAGGGISRRTSSDSTPKSVLVRRRDRHQPAAGRRARATAYEPAGGCQHRFHYRFPGRRPDPETGLGGRHQAASCVSVRFDEPDLKPVDMRGTERHALLPTRLPGRRLDAVQKDDADLVQQFNSLREAIEDSAQRNAAGRYQPAWRQARSSWRSFSGASSTTCATPSTPCETRTTAPL